MFSILRLQKLKSRSQISSSQNHNLRLKPVPNADPDRKHLNYVVGAKSYKELVGEMEDKFFKHNITPRKDSVQLVEVVLTASPEFFKNISGEEFKAWLKENYNWAKEEFGENLLQFVLHRDETTPHIHLIFTPITKDHRLSMKDLYGGKVKMSELQSRYSNKMAKFGLKRGKEQSQTKHTTIKEFYSFTNKLKLLKPTQIKKLSKQLEEFEKENENTEEKDKTSNTDYETLLKKIISVPTTDDKPKYKTKGGKKFKMK